MEIMMAKKIIVPITAPAIAPPLQPQYEEQTPPQQSSPMSHWSSDEQLQEDDLLMHLLLQHCSPLSHW